MYLSVWFSSTYTILSFTISLSAFIILQIFSSSKSESQPFFLIALAQSHNRCSVMSKTPCSFHSCTICCLYPLIGLPSSSKRLTSKETFHNNLIHVLKPICSDSSRMTTRSPLSNQGTPARRKTFPYSSSPIYTVIFIMLIWHFTHEKYSEFQVTQPPVFLSRHHLQMIANQG